ncbi:MAG TPA: hypothetical protein VL022_02050 [Moheibacter sp.]|nr:hypothetical protein [Moheibacter sp.]
MNASIAYIDTAPNPGNNYWNNDLFSFKINYNTIENELNAKTEALYNGNIAQTFWRTV